VSYPAATGELPLRAARTTVAALGGYVAALAGAEAVAAFVAPVPAAGVEGVVLLTLLTHYLLGAGAGTRVFAALALVPVLRLSSLALASADPLAFLVVSGLPVLLAVVLAARALDLPGVLALWEIRLRSQWHVALGALVLSGLAAPALGVASVTQHRSLPSAALAALVVLVFAGVLEELIFRGMIQGALDPLLGGWSVPVADALFAATYLGSGSTPYAVFMAAFGMACGWWVRRTGSLAGAAIGHGLLAAGLLLLSPAMP
jgi:membrane protease YdiL (CAAX protease family)